MITFAGVPALLETPAVRRWLDLYHPPAAWREFDATFWAGAGGWGLPLPPKPEPPPVRPGVLWWPTGAARFATCHLLFDSTRLAAVREAVGATNLAAELRIWDGTTREEEIEGVTVEVDNEVRADMRVVAERRVFDPAAAAGTGLTLVTLADARWDWRLKPLSVATAPASYELLVADIATALGVEITFDTGSVSAAFGVPSGKWVGFNRPATVVLDAALNAVGRRLVRRYDGTLVAQSWDAAYAARTAFTRKTSGGVVAADLAGRLLPAAVRVLFAVEDGESADPPHEEETTLVALALTQAEGAAGAAGQTATVVCDGVVYDGANGADCVAAADAHAEAWYGWRLSPHDLVLPGVRDDYAQTGLDDAVETDHSLDPGAARPEDLYPVRTRAYSWPASWSPPGDVAGTADAAAAAVACRGAFAGWGTTTCARFRIPAAGTGGCANVAATAGLYVTGGWDTTAGGWVMDATVTTAAGATTFTLFRDTDGNPSLVASWPDPDGSGSGAAGSRVGTFVGCVGGWMEFAFGGSDLCSGTGATDCDNVFRVRVTCDDCYERNYVQVVCKTANTFVAKRLYATFTGALAELGTVELPYIGTTYPIMEWRHEGVSGGSPNPPYAASCYDYPSAGWTIALKLCAAPDENDFTLTAATDSSRCRFTTGSGGVAVTAFDPFYAEFTGTVTDNGEGLCTCAGVSATIVITDVAP